MKCPRGTDCIGPEALAIDGQSRRIMILVQVSSLGTILQLHASLTVKVETRMAKRSCYPSNVEHVSLPFLTTFMHDLIQIVL